MINKVLLYNSGGGIGDSLQLMPIIISLKKHFTNCEIYILNAHQNHFKGKLRDFGIQVKDLDLEVEYFGFRWWHFFRANKIINKKKIDKFDLIVDLQSKLRNTLILKKIPCKKFYSPTLNFIFCNERKKFIKKPDIVSTTIENIGLLLNEQIKILRFSLRDIPNKYLIEAKRLLPNNNYIGLSITQGNVYRKKSWSIKKFVELANKFDSINKVPVFFIDKKLIELINQLKLLVPNAIFPEENSSHSSPALVAALAKRLEKAISIDNGVMHMIALANIPMILLFGPTSSEKFSPKINNLKIFDSKKIYNSSDINKITVEEVFNSI